MLTKSNKNGSLIFGIIQQKFQKKGAIMNIVQSVINGIKNINPQIRTYMLGILLSSNRKNCAAMSRETGFSVKTFYSFLMNGEIYLPVIEKKLVSIAEETRNIADLRALIADPSTVIKMYAENMEGLCRDRSGCTKRVERCLVPIFAAVSDKNTTIPLFTEFWIQKKVIGEENYKSKVEITQELIVKAIDKKVYFDLVSLDGAYSVKQMFDFYKKHNLKFVMRIPKNRLITTADGIKAQLKNHSALKLHRNERCKTIQATIYGDIYFFTIEKRKTRDDDWEEVFLVSNMNLPAKEQLAAYNLRWPMEKKIRTNKQKFGIGQSQVLPMYKQKAHIMASFLNYAILSSIKNDKKKKSVDEIVNDIRTFHFDDLISTFTKPNFSNHIENIDSCAKSVQNFDQNELRSAI